MDSIARFEVAIREKVTELIAWPHWDYVATVAATLFGLQMFFSAVVFVGVRLDQRQARNETQRQLLQDDNWLHREQTQ